MQREASARDVVQDLAGLITYGTSSQGLSACTNLAALPLLGRVATVGIDPDWAVLMLLRQVAQRAKNEDRREVVVAAALTGVEPPDDSRGVRGVGKEGGASGRRIRAAEIAGCDPETLKRTKGGDRYLQAFAAAVLNFVREVEASTVLERRFFAALGVKDVPATADPATSAQARLVPLAGVLRASLDAARSRCQLQGRAVYTADLLLALLDIPGGLTVAALTRVTPDLPDRTQQRVRSFVASLDARPSHPFRPFEWVERADVQQAQVLALQDGTGVVTDAHLFLALLDGDSGTLSALHDLWPDLVVIRQAVEALQAASPTVIRTPLLGDKY